MPPGQSNFFGIKVSKQGIPVQSASDSQLLSKDDFNQSVKTWYGQNGKVMAEGKLTTNPDSYGLKFFDSTGVGVAQFGTFPDGSYALKVAKPGVDVTTATNSQLIFNSQYNTLKIVLSGTVTIPANNGSQITTATVTHNLGFTPMCMAYVNSGSITMLPAMLAYGANPISGHGIEIDAMAVVDSINSTTVTFNVVVGAGGLTLPATNIKYYLYQETAN